MTVVTRFAPSPTGYLHIGGARTALFNWLYARHMGGEFLIRVEDTDKERNTPEAVQAIFDGLNWLGLKADEHPLFQSERVDRHVAVAEELLARDMAYLDDGAVRIRGIKGEQVIEDLVQGTVKWPQDIDDFVILRKDGTPTYMLAVVVDDYDMGITHVIRGDDHLNNAFRQLSIYRAMGWEPPVYAHIPLILDENGKKLSKRTGAAAVTDYQDMGILPEAMLNYLAKLGWGHGNDEFFSMAQAIEWFDIKDVGRNPARLDKKKLMNLNGQHIRNTADGKLSSEVVRILDARGVKYDDALLERAIPALKERSTDLNAMAEGTMFLWAQRPLVIEEKAQAKLDKQILADLLGRLEFWEWNHANLENVIHAYAENMELKLGNVVAPLRAALTGSTVSPPIYDVMLLLGKDETLKRIRDVL
jgi:glutamyl-tRNA synthetase